MNPSLLSQFQGALIGAAIADIMKPAIGVSPVLFSLPSPADATDERSHQDIRSSSNPIEQPENAGAATGDRPPGHWLIDLATTFIDPTHPSSLKSITLATYLEEASTTPTTSAGAWTWAIALLPMTLYVHDDAVMPSTYVQRFEQVFKHLGCDLGKAIAHALMAKELMIAITLAMVLNRQFSPKQHIPTLLTVMERVIEDSGISTSIQRGLCRVQEALEHRQGYSHLLQDLRTHCSIEPTDLKGSTSGQDAKHNDLLALMLLLYCFLDTPHQYDLALARFHHTFHRTPLPPTWEVPLRIILGTLLGSYRGYWGLPLPLVQRLKHSHEGQHLQARWGYDEAALLNLGWKLWAAWAGLDQAMITKGAGNPVNEQYDLDTVIAAPNIIRVPGLYPPHLQSR